MSNRKIQMPREVYIDPGIIKDTGEICKSLHLDKKILIVTGSHTYDVAKALTSNGYSLAGYTFGGWNTKADGTGTSYSDGQNVKNLLYFWG